MGSLLAELWEPSLFPVVMGTPSCGCPRTTGRAGGLSGALFVHPITNVTEEEPGADPVVTAAEGDPGN